MNAQKIITTLVAVGAGFAANKVIGVVWKKVTGHEAPVADDGEISLSELVVFAAVSGAVVAFTRTFVQREAAKWLSDKPVPKGS